MYTDDVSVHSSREKEETQRQREWKKEANDTALIMIAVYEKYSLDNQKDVGIE